MNQKHHSMHKRRYEEPVTELLSLSLEEDFLGSGDQPTGERFNDQTGSDNDDDWD